MQLINRTTLLNELEAVKFGLSSREIVEQSNCFLFVGGFVYTFNDEVFCCCQTCLEIEGAVKSKELLEILRKIPDDQLQVVVEDSQLRLKGKGKLISITMEHTVVIPLDSMKVPEQFHPLPENFTDHLKLAMEVTSTDASKFMFTCVHFNQDYIEACDNYQLTRIHTKFDFGKSMLLKADNLKSVTSMDTSEINNTDDLWVYFRSSQGIVIACRKYFETYPDLAPLLEVEGEEITLPRGLAEAADNASVFCYDASNDKQVLLNLKEGKLRIEGCGPNGSYKETRKIPYHGAPLKFLISPLLLIELAKKHHSVRISSNRIIVDGGNFKYVSCLGTPE